jgi:tetraacyldisaccharide 4'-kinase
MDDELLRRLISGEVRGVSACLLRACLAGISVPCCAATRLRNFLYDCGLFRAYDVHLPVVSVGNITFGGTGKSPMVAWLCNYLIERKLQPGIISGGYKQEFTHDSNNKISTSNRTENKTDSHNSSPSGVNDEYLELKLRLPTVRHIQNRDRVLAAAEFLRGKKQGRRRGNVDVLILDDGMQHRRIVRDYEVVLVDATNPFGYGWHFPRGFLRESVGGLRRADALILTRADMIPNDQRETIAKRLKKIAPNAVYAEAVHAPKKLVYLDKTESSIDLVAGKSFLGFCGIGNPRAFENLLSNTAGKFSYDKPKSFKKYSDHHKYTRTDLLNIINEALSLKVDFIICTMKDMVKLRQITQNESDPAFLRFTQRIPIVAINIDFKFINNETNFKNSLDNFIKNHRNNSQQ